MVSETKLDESFPIGQFVIEGFGVPYNVDRKDNGEWIMLFVREHIPSKRLSVENSSAIPLSIFRWNKPKKKEMFTQFLLQSKKIKHGKPRWKFDQKLCFIFI